MPKSSLSLYCSYYVDSKVDPAQVTNYGGIFPYLDLMLLTDLPALAQEALPKQGDRGWRHAEHLAALLALNLTGGDCIDDLEKLAGDPGISLYMGQIAKAAGAGDRRFSRGGDRDIPSLTSVREWLDRFHSPEEDGGRGYGKAYVPKPNEALSGLRKVNKEFIRRGFQLYGRSGKPPLDRATLEIDVTYIQTQKRDAFCCYKSFDAYAGLTVRWAETGLVIADEFRDGNISPAQGNREALEEAIAHVNELGIRDVWVRSDSAAHQERILKMLSGWEIEGMECPVKFAIGYTKSKDFREEIAKVGKSEWEEVRDAKGRLLYEIAEVPFVSNAEALIKAVPFRHIVVRRQAKQGILSGLGMAEGELGSEETMEIGGRAYHVHAIISNIGEEWTNPQVLEWYNERCGGGEAIHSILKSDLAAGQLPSDRFGANAAWWTLAVLANNIHALLKKLALPKGLAQSRFKRLRYHLINVPARMVQHARRCAVRYFQTVTLYLVQHIRSELAAVATAPG